MAGVSFEKDKIRALAAEEAPLEYRFHYAGLDDKLCIGRIVSSLLHILKKDYLKANLKYIVQELVENANRALAKRVYFQAAGLDIADPREYAEGMTGFADRYHEHLEEFVETIRGSGLGIRISFDIEDRCLRIGVANSGLPTSQEMERIRYRIETCRTVRNNQEIFDLFADTTEGAGLGIAMAFLLLRTATNNPVSMKPFELDADEISGETVARLAVALDTVPEKLAEELSDIIGAAISSLPVYPEHIMRLERMISREETPLSEMASVIARDPALTAELLKTINSAQYYLPQKVHSIQNAVSLIGIRGLRNLLLSFGAQRIIDTHYGRQEQMWKHAYHCAFFAYAIAKGSGKRHLCDDVYIGGILHDIGEIIVANAHADLHAGITAFCRNKGIRGDIVERLAIGCSHAKIGGSILRKWNFPAPIVAAVEYSADPSSAPEEYRETVEIVYAADQLVMLAEKRITPSSMDLEVLGKFNLDSAEAIDAYLEDLNSRYKEQLQKGS